MLNDYQLAKKYFSMINTKKKKKPCKVCFEKLDIVIAGYTFLINNVESYLKYFGQKHLKFIDEVVPQHLQAELFKGKERLLTSLKTQWLEAGQRATNIVEGKKENSVYQKKYYKTMKGRLKAIIKLYNRTDAKRMHLKGTKKVYFIDNIPIIIKFSEKKQKVVASKTYGSQSYTDYEIELMEKLVKQ